MHIHQCSPFLIPTAASEQGLKIMAMLYLTPVLPLGLVSYMCGTTSMNIVSFAVAKIASAPLYLIYTFMGASAHSLIKHGGKGAADTLDETTQLEENKFHIIAGLLLSVIMMTLITKHIKKELMKILEKQKRDKVERVDDVKQYGDQGDNFDENGVELGLVARRRGQKSEYTPQKSEYID